MGVRTIHSITEYDHGSNPAWLITFCDLIFLLLAFFVLKFSMSAPKQKFEITNETKREQIKKIAGGEESIIVGAFSPGDSAELSFRGKTALASYASQATELGRDVVIRVEVLTLPYELWQNPDKALDQLNQQRKTVLRQLVDSGLPLESVLFEPISLSKPDGFTALKEDKSLSSRVSLVLQEKRS